MLKDIEDLVRVRVRTLAQGKVSGRGTGTLTGTRRNFGVASKA